MDKEGEVTGLNYEWAFEVFEEQRVYMGDSIREFLTEIDRARNEGNKERESIAVQMIFRILRDARYLMGDPLWLAFVTELEFRIVKTKDGFSLEKAQGVFNFTGPMFETSYVTASDDDFYQVNPDYALDNTASTDSKTNNLRDQIMVRLIDSLTEIDKLPQFMASKKNHIDAVKLMYRPLHQLTTDLAIINSWLLCGASRTICATLSFHFDDLLGKTEKESLSVEQFRKAYAAVLTLFVFMFTLSGRDPDIAAGSQRLLAHITRDQETVASVTRKLERCLVKSGKPDGGKLAAEAFDLVREAFSFEIDVIELMNFGQVSLNILHEVMNTMRTELENE